MGAIRRTTAIVFGFAVLLSSRLSHAARPEREVHLERAATLAHTGKLAEAEALLTRQVTLRPEDDEARTLLARVLAWQKRYALSEEQFALVLQRHPEDRDAVLGLADLYLWQRRFRDATRLLDRVSRMDSRASDRVDVMERRARIAAEDGDPLEAARWAKRASALDSRDPTMAALVPAGWTTEIRLTGRAEFYQGDMPALPSGELQVTQRLGRFSLLARTAHASRPSTSPGARTEYNAFHELGLAYRWASRSSLSFEMGLGAPAHSVAIASATLAAEHAPTQWLRGRLLYGFRLYADKQTAQIIGPTLAVAPTRWFELEARYWLVISSIPRSIEDRGAELLHSGGGAAWFAPHRQFRAGIEYARAVQVEMDPGSLKLLTLRSHILSSTGDLILADTWGIRPRFAAERRESPSGFSPWILTGELGVYRRF